MSYIFRYVKTIKKSYVAFFILITVFVLFGFDRLTTSRLRELEMLFENALQEVIMLNADGISIGYFQWDGMFDAISDENVEFFDQYKEELQQVFIMVEEAQIIQKPFEGQSNYRIYTEEGISYIEFGVFDSEQSKYVLDKMIKIRFNPSVVFNSVFDNDDQRFFVKISDDKGVDGINVLGLQRSLKIYHYISAVSIAVLFLFLYRGVKKLTINAHYEVEGLANVVMMLSRKDAYTADHSRDVAKNAVLIADKMGLSKKIKRVLNKAGYLHDIGKIGIPETILNKATKLTENEYEEIKKHSLIGYEIVSQFPNLKEVAIVVKHHHEMLDGSGYPDGLKGNSIPQSSQILTVADVFSALTTDRPYRKGFSYEKAFAIMQDMPLNQDMLSILMKHYKIK